MIQTRFSRQLTVSLLIGTALIVGGCSSGKKSAVVMADMQKAMVNVSGLGYNATINATGFQTPLAQGINTNNINVTISGHAGLSNITKPTSQAQIIASTGDVANRMTIDAEFRSIDNELFVKVHALPLLFGPIPNVIDTWLALPQASQTATSTQSLSNEQQEQIKKLISASVFLKVDKDLGKATINNNPTQHYKVHLDAVVLKKLVADIASITDKKATAQESAAINGQIDIMASQPIEIWVGAKDNFLYRLAATSIKPVGQSGTIDMTIDFFDHNKSVNIEKPANATSLEKVFANMMGSMMPATTDLNAKLPGDLPPSMEQKLKAMSPADQEKLDKMLQQLPPDAY